MHGLTQAQGICFHAPELKVINFKHSFNVFCCSYCYSIYISEHACMLEIIYTGLD